MFQVKKKDKYLEKYLNKIEMLLDRDQSNDHKDAHKT